MKLTQAEVSVVGVDRAAHYAALLSEQERSGLSVRDFALSRGLSPVTLYLWRRKLGRTRRRREGAASSGMVAVDVVGRDERDAAKGVSGFEVLLVNGHRVRVPDQFDAARLADLMAVLLKC